MADWRDAKLVQQIERDRQRQDIETEDEDIDKVGERDRGELLWTRTH